MSTRSTRNHSRVLNKTLDANHITHTNVVLGAGAGESLSLEEGEITCIGFGAGKSLTTSGNTCLGGQTLQAACGTGNTCVGLSSGKYTTGDKSVYIGYLAGRNASSGNKNIAIGNEALGSTATNPSMSSSYNIAIGNEAGQSLTSGHSNVIIGRSDGVSSTAITADNCILIGRNINPPSVSTDGQVIIGNSSYNTTSVLNASSSIALKIGNSTVLTATATTVGLTGLLLDGNNRALDCPGSYHHSGSGASEKRTLTLFPLLVADDDAANSVRGVDNPDGSNLFTNNMAGGVRKAGSAQECFSHFTLPENWKGYAIQVNYVHKSTDASIVGRISVVTRSNQRVSSSPYSTVNLALTTNGVNSVTNLTTKIVHGGGLYSIVYHEMASTTDYVYIGSTIYIERI